MLISSVPDLCDIIAVTHTTMPTINTVLRELKWPTKTEYPDDKSPTRNRTLSTLEKAAYPVFGRVRRCDALPVMQDGDARDRVQWWLSQPHVDQARHTVRWSLAQQNYRMTDEFQLRGWLARQVTTLELIAPPVTPAVWPVHEGAIMDMSIGVAYKNSRRTLEYDIMPIVVEQWHNRTNRTVYCPIEAEIESAMEEN